MRLHDAARALIGPGADTTLITLNPDGNPQATVVWMAVQRTEDGDDELVTAHLSEHRTHFPPADAPPGYLTRIRIDRLGGVGPWTT